VRDIDILSQFRSLRVNVSIPTDSERVRLAFEPKAPPLEKRWQAIRELQAAGIAVGICVTPTLPVENAKRFAQDLAEAKSGVLVLQDFHESNGGFGADTSPKAMHLAAAMEWNRERFREFFDFVQAQTTVYEGEAGFFPPDIDSGK
jgi:DNA repair photolyase